MDSILQGNRIWPNWECEAPAEPGYSIELGLGRSLALPNAIALQYPFIRPPIRPSASQALVY